jgi:hypothetical protein
MRAQIEKYIRLGQAIGEAQTTYLFHEEAGQADNKTTRVISQLDDDAKEQLGQNLAELSSMCEDLELPIASEIISQAIDDLPQSDREYQLILSSVFAELRKTLFLYIPIHRAQYWDKDDIISESAKQAFPVAASELREAANCFCTGANTASVFHAMRAVEHGLRALATEVGLVFDVQLWGNVIGEIESKLGEYRNNGITGLSKGQKDERLQFLSESAKEFAYFKDGWRNYVSHAKATYGERQALTVLNHVCDFIERLSSRLKE